MEVLPGQDRLDQLDLALLRSKVEGRVPSGIDSVHRREVGPAHDGYSDVAQVVVDRTVQASLVVRKRGSVHTPLTVIARH